jgi:5-methylcytosine-specific restriction endonuclease McrA
MVRFDDLTGKKFTRLLVLQRVEKEFKKPMYWLCQCDCGKQVEVISSTLKAENGTKSCGCLRSELRRKSGKDYTGQKFGMLTIIRRDFSSRKDHNPHWLCKCECGGETIVAINNLKKGSTVSCGCFGLERARSRAKKLQTKKEGDSALHSVMYTYKYNANKRDIDFKLTDEEFGSLIFGNCGYCSATPNNKSRNRYGNGDVIYNGIDRIDNGLPYEISNCITCCQNCNRAKYKMSYQEFSDWIRRLYVNLPVDQKVPT